MKKLKNFIPAITLIIGIVSGYYYCKSVCGTDKSDSKSSSLSYEKNTAQVAIFPDGLTDSLSSDKSGSGPISRDSARMLIDSFQTQQKRSLFGQLQTPSGELLQGFYINREPLDTILRDKNIKGISIYLAKSPKHAASNQRIYTLIYAGATESQTVNADGKIDPKFKNDGTVYEYVYPCPGSCGTLGLLQR